MSFIGKEKDIESNLGDFGVRKYDEDIGRFTSIDPLWEKYYSWTLYHYCSNNPVMGKDPSGKEVWITYKEEVTEDDGSKNTVDKKVQYKNGKLYNEDGKAYKGNNAFVQTTYDELRRFSQSNSAIFRSEMAQLVKSNFVYTIAETNIELSDFVNSAEPDDKEEFGAFGTPMGGTLLVNINKINKDCSFAKFLAHEVMGHFYDYMTGNNDYGGDVPGVGNNDIRAVGMQNIQSILEGKKPTNLYNGYPIPWNLLPLIMEK
jgi:RHS repeat-associated protein